MNLTMEPLQSKFIGCLIGTAVGDSLGARCQGVNGNDITIAVADLSPRYTDDTALTIGVAESLIAEKDFHFWHMADRFLKNYEKEPWRRYSSTISSIFRMMRNGKLGFGMLDRDIYPGGSYGNGAAMRIAPVGLMYHDDPRVLRDIAFNCASITHSHEQALEGAAMQACAVALAVLGDPEGIGRDEFLGALRMYTKQGPYQDKLKTLIRLLDEGPTKQEIAEQLGTGSAALDSVPTAVYSFLAHRDFKSAVSFAVSLGGDADTIGAMTGAIAGACYGIEGIPSQWRETVENHDYLVQLAQSLWEVKTRTGQNSGTEGSSEITM